MRHKSQQQVRGKDLFRVGTWEKKLFAQNPFKQRKEVEKKVEVCSGKEKIREFTYTSRSNEREVRTMLSNKITGAFLGILLLIPELLDLKAWDLLKGWTGKLDYDLEPRLGLQLVNESAICVTRMRRKQSLAQPVFQIANGLPYLATDRQIHDLLDEHTIHQAKEFQLQLAKIRHQNGHFPSNSLAIDPHRLLSESERTILKKKFSAHDKLAKILQTFFVQDPKSGQPCFVLMGCPCKTATQATLELSEMSDLVFDQPKLFIADKEHCNEQLFSHFQNHQNFDLLTPLMNTPNVKEKMDQLDYERKWAGYSIAETTHEFQRGNSQYRMIAQRLGEMEADWQYSGFLTTSQNNHVDLITEDYPQRWSIEELFRFEQDIGWKKVLTWNQNIRFGKMSLALLAQAAVFQFKSRLPLEYQKVSESTIAEKYLRNAFGDIKIKDDKVIVTFYNMASEVAENPFYNGLSENLAARGIDPRIPWLHGFKPEFRFK